MNIPDNLKYSTDHEWIRIEGETGLVGITDFAQSELGDIVFIETPAIGTKIEKGKSFGTIEAVKAVSDLLAPVSGTVTEINAELKDHPEIINKDPYIKGWILKISVPDITQLDTLMNAESYKLHIGK